jgi:hypothetical protein
LHQRRNETPTPSATKWQETSRNSRKSLKTKSENSPPRSPETDDQKKLPSAKQVAAQTKMAELTLMMRNLERQDFEF